LTQLVFYVAFAVGVSFLCSLFEATLLSTRLAALSEQRSQGIRGAALLFEIKSSRIHEAISAVLILNTIANTLGATMAGAQAAYVFGSRWTGAFSGVLTFLILAVSEITPKTLGAVYARQLGPSVGWALHLLLRLMAPALVVSRSLTRLLAHGDPAPLSRGELAAVISIAVRDGALPQDEATLFANLLRLAEVQIEDVMTPRTVVFMMPATATAEDLIADPQVEAFSRIPLYRDQPDNVVGYVLQRDVLKALAVGGDRRQPLETWLREITFLPELISVGAALKQFLRRREPIAMATDEHGAIAGLVTLEDLTETVLGAEIVDEFDRVVDLRRAALELRDRRLERLRRKRELVLGRPEPDADD